MHLGAQLHREVPSYPCPKVRNSFRACKKTNSDIVLFLSRAAPKKILDTILDHIGNTPMVRINKIGKSEGLECEIRAFPLLLSSLASLLIYEKFSSRAVPAYQLH